MTPQLGRDGRRLVVIAVALAAVAVAPAARSSSERVITASQLLAKLDAGPVTLADYRVVGEIRLSRRLVNHELICVRCTFSGSLFASGATFAKVVDLSGSTFRRLAYFNQATFRAPALFGSWGGVRTAPGCANHRRSHFLETADFEFATFDDLAVFAGAAFRGETWATLARFQQDAIFANVCSLRSIEFRRAAFGGTADFSSGAFSQDAAFDDAVFHGRTDFAQARFLGNASFLRTRFDDGATFEEAEFDAGHDRTTTVSFDSATAGGVLDFAYAVLHGQATFTRMSATGSISLANARVEPRCEFYDAAIGKTKQSEECVSVAQISTPDFELGVPATLHAVLHEERPYVLGLIESSAKARGDISTANDAHYALRILDSQSDSWPVHALDFAFYRVIAGYFVRPLQPLAALLVLAGVATLIRFGRTKLAGSDASRHRRPRSRLARARSGVLQTAHALGDGYLRTLSLIGPARTATADVGQGRWVEVLAYRLLLACVLIGLANSNPTLRQMFDAIR